MTTVEAIVSITPCNTERWPRSNNWENKMSFDWPYYTLRKGRLCDEQGRQIYSTSLGVPCIPSFANAAEAEAWLEANDLRGNVKPPVRP